MNFINFNFVSRKNQCISFEKLRMSGYQKQKRAEENREPTGVRLWSPCLPLLHLSTVVTLSHKFSQSARKLAEAESQTALESIA